MLLWPKKKPDELAELQVNTVWGIKGGGGGALNLCYLVHVFIQINVKIHVTCMFLHLSQPVFTKIVGFKKCFS